MDAFSEYRAGFEIRTPQLCTSILIETHPKYEPNRSDYSVRRYEFEYANDVLNGAAMLSAVRVTGFDDSGNPDQELPPLPFRYTPFEPQGRKFLLTTSADLPAERPIERRLQEV